MRFNGSGLKVKKSIRVLSHPANQSGTNDSREYRGLPKHYQRPLRQTRII